MRNQQGLTLIEMVVTIVIVAIIASVAFPAYKNYLIRTRRSEATIALLDLATRMEKYYAENNNSYASADITTNLGLSSTTTTNGFYTLSIPSLSATSYTLQATPVSTKSQADDSICADFTLTQAGQKGISGTGTAAECWGS